MLGAGHAADHWRTSGHCYALELDSQRVWDYVGDNYVHRLIQVRVRVRVCVCVCVLLGKLCVYCGV